MYSAQRQFGCHEPASGSSADGGRLVFIILEMLRGKPVDPEKEGMVHMAGMAALMTLMLFVLFNDIRNLL